MHKLESIISKWINHEGVKMATYLKAGFGQLPMLIFILLLFSLCACTAGNSDVVKEVAINEKAVGEAISEESSLGSLEIIASESGEVDHLITEEGMAEVVDDIYLAAEAAARAAAQAAAKIPKLWIEYSTDKDIQAKYDIIQETETTAEIDMYNRFVSRVLYEYLQKNEPGKEYGLLENFNEWYSKTAEKLQTIKEEERKKYLNAASIEYIKPITAEIEGKFDNACEYTQYLFTHAKYMLNFFPETEYRRQIDGVTYGFLAWGNRCLLFVAYPIDTGMTYDENFIRIPLDGKLDLYATKCMRGSSLEYKGRLYRLTIDEIGVGIKHVLYELEQNKLNYKSVCEIK